MKIKSTYGIFSFLLVIVVSVMLTSYSNGPAATVGLGYTGAPIAGESGMVCGDCHNGGNYGDVEVTFSTEYGNRFSLDYPNCVSFTIETSGTPMGYGFQVIILDDLGNQVSAIYDGLSPNLKLSDTSFNTYIEHNGISSENEFSFCFTLDYDAPANLPNQLGIYVAANAVDAGGTTYGDTGSSAQFVLYGPFVDEIPVTLVSFTATPFPSSIRLDWTTETEQDNDYFALEHSTNGVDFSDIKIITGAGTTDERHTYTYTHTTPVKGNNYYRLRQVDFDGTETLSEIVAEKFISKFEETTVFPQPASMEATIYLHAPANESGTMEVYDINGRLVHSNDTQLIEGDNYLNLNCENWVAGHYVIHLQSQQIGEQAIHFLKK